MSMPPQDSPPPGPTGGDSLSLRRHLRRTVQLATPVVIGRSGALAMAAVDIAMTGRHSADELAVLGLGIALCVTPIVFGMGLSTGTLILTAQVDGAREYRRLGAIWRAGMLVALGYALLVLAVLPFGGAFLALIGQDPGLSEGAGRVATAFAWGAPGLFGAIATGMFLEGLSRPMPGMIVILLGNLVNFGLNLIFIDGGWGVPAMGGEGAMIATSLARWAMLGGALAWIAVLRAPDGGRLWRAAEPVAPLVRRLSILGAPLGLANLMESSAFMAMSLAAGYLGATAIAGYQVAFNIVAILFMMSVGIATATGVRVGNAVGRHDPVGRARAGWVGVSLAGAMMLVMSGVVWLFHDALVALYAQDPAVLAVAVACLLAAAPLLAFDGMQVAMIAGLRGGGDPWMPLWLQLAAFWGVGVSAGLLIAFPLGGGAPGLVTGIFIGAVASSLFNGLRFRWLTRQPIRRY